MRPEDRISQQDIDKLFGQEPGASPGQEEGTGSAEAGKGSSFDALLDRVAAGEGAEGRPTELEPLEGADGAPAPENLELLRDVSLRVRVELGRGRMVLGDILRLRQGSVVELDKLAGDPLDIYVNDRLIGRGEVMVLNDTFCIRITEILSPREEGAGVVKEP